MSKSLPLALLGLKGLYKCTSLYNTGQGASSARIEEQWHTA